jgi:oligosaccharide repeat unit polymerase
MSIMALLFLYYTVFGPLYFIAVGETDFLGVDFRSLFWKGWLASLVSLITMGAGYLSYRGSKLYVGQVCSDELLQKFAMWLIGAAFFAMLVWTTFFRATASMFNPFASDAARGEVSQFTTNPFANYLVNFINLSIPAMVLSQLIWLKRRSPYALAALIFVFLFGVCFFLSSGFRFRIIWMVIAMVAAYYLWKQRRPNPLVLLSGGAALLAALALIGMTRTYWSGLSMSKARGASVSDYLDHGFEEAGIFMSVCSVVDAIPKTVAHTHWDPFWITLTFPIPRALWPSKPESQTLLAMAESFGSDEAYEAGAAMPFYAEWYVAFGWTGLVISSFLVGFLCKRLWVWFLQRRDDKLVILIYTTTLGFLYFFFSRGYTPIMTLNFVCGLLPFFLFYGWLRRKAFSEALAGWMRFQRDTARAERVRQRQLDRSRETSS